MRKPVTPRSSFLNFFILKVSFYSLVGCFVQSTKQIMEEDATRLAVNIITVGSFPVMFQVICILHNLLSETAQIIAGVDVGLGLKNVFCYAR